MPICKPALKKGVRWETNKYVSFKYVTKKRDYLYNLCGK